MKFKSVKAVGKWVVIEARKSKQEEEKKTKSGLILPNQAGPAGTSVNTNSGKEVFRLYIGDIGPDVKDPTYKVGDEVIVDNYDCQAIQDDDENTYILVNSEKIKCVVDSED